VFVLVVGRPPFEAGHSPGPGVRVVAVASNRGEIAAARVAAAALRTAQLRERLARLRSGDPSTPEDVALARASAANQRTEALRAQERLLRTFAVAAALQGSTSAGPRLRSGGAVEAPARPERPRPDAATEPPAADVNRGLRRALASIASSDAGGGWSKDRRQELWIKMADQCGQESWQGWSHALCRTAPRLLPALRGMALSGYSAQDAPHLLAVTDAWTREAEEVAQLVGEGPAVDAYRTQAPVLVRRLDDEQARWPAYVDATRSAAVTAIGALPVQLNGVGLGSLSLYPRDEGGRGPIAWADYFFLATVAAKTLLVDLDAVEHGWPTKDLVDDPIQMAVGMLAVQLGVGTDEASARLRAFAFSNARRLGEVAEAVLDGSLLIA
jgi:hypothetical protein